MEFGIYHEFPTAEGGTDADAFHDAFSLSDAAEDWGLDVLWLAELHFVPERSVLSAPLCIASAIAARTQRMQIGIAVQVLPLGNPIRLAEEAATVDQISRGRLIFGVGRSGVAKTYEAYNIPYAESRQRFAETLDIIEQAWSNPRVSYDGTWFQVRDVAITPRPFHPAGPPIRVAATSPDTYISIGKQGKPIFLGIKHEDARILKPHIDAYRKAWRDAGHPGSGAIYLRAPGYVAATNQQAREDCEASLMHYYRNQADLALDTAKRAGVDGAEKRLVAAEELGRLTYESALEGSILVGSPDEVSRKISDLHADLQLDGIMIEMNAGGKIPHHRQLAALKLLCQDVMPSFSHGR